MMQAGMLRHYITIQNLAPTQDAVTGEVSEVWQEFAKVWADVKPSSVREFISAGVNDSRVTASVKIRYLAGVLPSMRILHGDHIYNIEGILADPHSGMEWMTLPVSEVISG